MPELPEVETIRRGLSQYILNKKIVQTKVMEKKSFISGFPEFMNREWAVKNIRRFGKALVIDLDGGFSMMIHLRMTGQMVWQGEIRYAAGHPSENFVAELPNRQTRVVFEFEDGKLFFNDQRKFGFVKVLKTEDVEKDDFIRRLAKEPWEMSVSEFSSALRKHANAPIKAVILDQSVVAGLGNIYADESLFYADIHPATKVANLTDEQIRLLLEGARKVMQESIDSGGSTMRTYVKADGSRGDYLEKFAKVFRKEGTACPKCGTIIKKIRVAGRGTHICPECQK